MALYEISGEIFNPPDQSLRCIVDNRSGQKLEIVVPIYNEAKRLSQFMSLYSCFDLVFLDGGSDDQSYELIMEANGSIYRREGIDLVGEGHYVSYVNQHSVSGRCFYMMIDEYVNISDMCQVDTLLMEENSGISVIKLECLFNVVINKQDSRYLLDVSKGMARGCRRGGAVYRPQTFHNSLVHSKSVLDQGRLSNIYLHHQHLKSLSLEYGKLGRYISHEISLACKSSSPSRVVVRNFALRPLKYILIDHFYFKAPPYIKVYRAIELAINFLLAVLAFIENKYAPSLEEQSLQYSNLNNKGLTKK
ncbi:hypothetical protein [Synechococcus sp. W4D4]|uniref:hypothetical protein n=1 Tax=Synechococcus sp. W4D4 TaxID=3392294 RepID=UPI0039E7C967